MDNELIRFINDPGVRTLLFAIIGGVITIITTAIRKISGRVKQNSYHIELALGKLESAESKLSYFKSLIEEKDENYERLETIFKRRDAECERKLSEMQIQINQQTADITRHLVTITRLEKGVLEYQGRMDQKVDAQIEQSIKHEMRKHGTGPLHLTFPGEEEDENSSGGAVQG
jgi:predicted  nucleic acid-binding Zn-ribbon protein